MMWFSVVAWHIKAVLLKFEINIFLASSVFVIIHCLWIKKMKTIDLLQ